MNFVSDPNDNSPLGVFLRSRENANSIDTSKPQWWLKDPRFIKKCFSCFRHESEVKLIFTSPIPTYPRYTCVDCEKKRCTCPVCNVSFIDHEGTGTLCDMCREN